MKKNSGCNGDGRISVESMELRFYGGLEGAVRLILGYTCGCKLDVVLKPRFAKAFLVLFLAREADMNEPLEELRGWRSYAEVIQGFRQLNGASIERSSVVSYMSGGLAQIRRRIRARGLSEQHVQAAVIERLRLQGYRIAEGVRVWVTGLS